MHTTWLLVLTFAATTLADFGLWPACHEDTVLEPGLLFFFNKNEVFIRLFIRDCRVRSLGPTAFIYPSIHLPNGIYLANYVTEDDVTQFLKRCTYIEDFPFDSNNDLLASVNMKLKISSTMFSHCFYEQNEISYAHDIRDLNLADNRIGGIEDSNTFAAFESLQKLNLDSNLINYIHEHSFKYLTRIRCIYLAKNSIKWISAKLFQNLRFLEEIDLSNNQLQHIDSGAFRGTLLKRLDLRDNRLTYLADNFYLDIPRLEMFGFENNLWQCACLGELLTEAKVRRIQYSRYTFNGWIPVCVSTSSECIRLTE